MKMQVEIRADKVVIEGYVNAIERFSKPLTDNRGQFVERIMTGAFERAIRKNDNILGLLNHDSNEVLGSTKEGTVKLREDSIGLHARIETSHKRTMEKARAGKLVGWSFGFNSPVQRFATGENGMEERTITDLTLLEVSVLDDERTPAYYGTSIESRATGEGEEVEITEIRAVVETQPEYVTIRNEEGGDPSDRGGDEEDGGGSDGGDEADEEAPDLTEHKTRINKLTLQGVEENE